MPSPFHGISMAGNALRAFQRAMEVVGNNMANVNTRGYSRQTIEMAASSPTTIYTASGGQQLGTGVNISAIARTRDFFLESRMQTALSDFGRSGTLANNLKAIEGVLNETGNRGISSALDGFFNAFSALGSSPNDAAARMEMRNAGVTLTTRIRDTYARLEDMQTNSTLQLKQQVEQINDLANTIHQLNGQIAREQVLGASPTNLADQRDLAIQDLSQLVNLSTQLHPDGTMSVTVSNFSLVDQHSVRTLPDTFDASTQSILDGTRSIPIRGGRLLGTMQSLQHLSAAMGNLDTLSNTLRAQINPLHASGINSLGNTGVNFFNDVVPPALPTGARDFNLSDEVLANADSIVTGVSGAPGDGGLALQFSELRNTKLAGLGNKSVLEYWRTTVAGVASESAFNQMTNDSHGSIVDQVQAQIDGVSGVSLDDEMAELVKFQRSYQAAARVLSILDSTTEDLLGMLR